MIEHKLDTNEIETALYDLLETKYEGGIHCGNRPTVIEDKASSFIVVKASNGGDNITANYRVVSSRMVCSIQIWTRDLKHGMKDMQLESAIRALIFTLIPTTVGNYKFTYMNDMGSRDLLGFHGKYINLNCYII